MSCVLEDAVSFEPLGGVTSIFFDDKTHQIFSVRSRGATGIIAKGFATNQSSTFRLEDKGPIISIKLSPDQKVLSVQRNKSTVEFFNVTQLGVNGVLDGTPYEQPCKTKNSTLLGFYWICNEIVFLTSLGIEIFNVIPEKRMVKSVRQLNHLINWFVFCPASSLLVVSSTKSTSALQLFNLKSGGIYKLPKIDLGGDNSKVEVKEKDVHVFTLYNDQHYICLIHHPGEKTTIQFTEIHMYSVNKDLSTVTKTHILQTNFNGSNGLAMHAIDDILAIHDRKSGETWLFDIGLAGESDGSVCHHKPVGHGTKIHGDNLPEDIQEYPVHWVVFAPNIIIDANLGLMWHLKLKILPMKVEDTPNSLEMPRLISFLLQREGAKNVLLDTLMEWCQHHATDLNDIGASFDKINREYRLYIDQQLAPSVALSASVFSSSSLSKNESTITIPANFPSPSKVILDQADIYTNIISPLLELATQEHQTISIKRVIAIVIEYLRSLSERQIPAQHFLYEILINLLVRSCQWYQLHQLLQYHIIADTKPLACILLSLEAVFPAAFQLAMDMLSRLKTSGEEITEILLSKGKVISALLYANNQGMERQIPARKFLQVAKDTGNSEMFSYTRNWLEKQNLLSAKDAHDYPAPEL